jgi:hypothetical protein
MWRNPRLHVVHSTIFEGLVIRTNRVYTGCSVIRRNCWSLQPSFFIQSHCALLVAQQHKNQKACRLCTLAPCINVAFNSFGINLMSPIVSPTLVSNLYYIDVFRLSLTFCMLITIFTALKLDRKQLNFDR